MGRKNKALTITYLVGNLGAGGLERFVTRVALRAQTGGELKPAVICLLKREGLFLGDLESAGIRVYEAPKNWMRSPIALWKLSQLITELNPDIVHSQVNFSLLQQCIAVLLSGKSVFCVTERSQHKRTGWALLRRRLQFRLLRFLRAHYSANSQAVASHLARQVNVAESSIPVLTNGVATIEPNPELRIRLRTKYGWSNDDIVIGYIGRFAKVKGHAGFLQAMAQAHQRSLPIKACLLGDGPERSEIEKIIQSLDLAGHVKLVGTVDNVDEWLQAFDFVALFSSREGMPNAVLEAMSAGLAVVATPVGAIPELLDHGASGILVNSNAISDLVEGLTQLATCSEKRVALGMAARKRVESIFGLEQIYLNLMRYYQEILNR